jgi:hypothetical protein
MSKVRSLTKVKLQPDGKQIAATKTNNYINYHQGCAWSGRLDTHNHSGHRKATGLSPRLAAQEITFGECGSGTRPAIHTFPYDTAKAQQVAPSVK